VEYYRSAKATRATNKLDINTLRPSLKCTMQGSRAISLHDRPGMVVAHATATVTQFARVGFVPMGAAALPHECLGAKTTAHCITILDKALHSSRTDLHQRIVAEKYVAAAYLVVLLALGLWFVIHAAHMGRLRRDLEALTEQLVKPA
jgi:hypothetical protein